jgi:acyl carrier protein
MESLCVQPSYDAAAALLHGEAVALRPSPRERLRSLVAEIVARKSPDRSFSDDDTLSEIGVTSVDMVTLLFSVENEFCLEVPQQDITPDVFRSIATIDGLIRRLQPQA